ncbi:MAG TPA: DUF6152 family protein [Gammaproteobacteria bacterium]|nr:DUF6152 family protein [Gammaproteobacteria bacterium]
MRHAHVRAAHVAATAAAVLLARGALAHHSPAGYDMQSQHTVEGTIAEYEWGNPHVYLSVRENGSDKVWVVEAFPSTAMKQYGWSKQTFALGDRVVVTGHPGRNPARTVLFLQAVRRADAAAMLYDAKGAVAAPPSAPSQTFRATSLAGTWSSSVGPAFGNFFGPGVAQLGTPQGAAAVAEFRDAANPGLECVPFTIPVYMILPGFRSIDVRADAVVIRGEDAAVDRTVHLDAATHEGAAPAVQGHSIGRWDNGVLVVDTANFTPHRIGNGAGLPSGTRKHLVERFALNAQGGLTYSFELEDPEFLKQRVTGTADWLYRPDVEFTATPCSRDNAQRFLAE